uniref:SHSP domain-containing protein n=1 Tax=Setaria digitata TaxID=48799 RepID=A0A915PP17_9BILA
MEVPIFFLTDILRYKPVIILEAACLFGTWALLLWGQTVRHMQIMQILFGISSAAEIAYYSYMYAVVKQKHYKLITSYIRAAALVGKFCAFGLAQFLISFQYGSYLLLNQISFGSICVVLLIAAILPSIPSKRIDNRVGTETVGSESKVSHISESYEEEVKNDERNSEERATLDTNLPYSDDAIAAYFRSILHHFKIFKRNETVLKWSIWWALTSCGIFQVMNYVQTLWATMQTYSDTYNGITECANTFIGALISFLVQYMNVNWTRRGEYVLLITSTLLSLLLAIMSQTEVVYVSYILYVVVITVYHLLITVASVNIATQLDSASYGLIFGWNTFVALFLQTVLTFAVADKHGFSLSIRAQILKGCILPAFTHPNNFRRLFSLILIYACSMGKLRLLVSDFKRGNDTVLVIPQVMYERYYRGTFTFLIKKQSEQGSESDAMSFKRVISLCKHIYCKLILLMNPPEQHRDLQSRTRRPYFNDMDFMPFNETLRRMFENLFHSLEQHYRQLGTSWASGLTNAATCECNFGSSIGQVVNDAEKFAMEMDVSLFRPEDLKVSLRHGELTIEGHQKQQRDQHGLIERHFVRRFTLPDDVDDATLTSHLKENGILEVNARKKNVPPVTPTRNIPIQMRSLSEKRSKSIKHANLRLEEIYGGTLPEWSLWPYFDSTRENLPGSDPLRALS